MERSRVLVFCLESKKIKSANTMACRGSSFRPAHSPSPSFCSLAELPFHLHGPSVLVRLSVRMPCSFRSSHHPRTWLRAGCTRAPQLPLVHRLEAVARSCWLPPSSPWGSTCCERPVGTRAKRWVWHVPPPLELLAHAPPWTTAPPFIGCLIFLNLPHEGSSSPHLGPKWLGSRPCCVGFFSPRNKEM